MCSIINPPSVLLHCSLLLPTHPSFKQHRVSPLTPTSWLCVFVSFEALQVALKHKKTVVQKSLHTIAVAAPLCDLQLCVFHYIVLKWFCMNHFLKVLPWSWLKTDLFFFLFLSIILQNCHSPTSFSSLFFLSPFCQSLSARHSFSVSLTLDICFSFFLLVYLGVGPFWPFLFHWHHPKKPGSY